MADDLLGEAIKIRMIDAMDISLSSLNYWNNQSRGLPWYAQDVMGAIFAWNTGPAALCFAIAGPAGAGAAILGCAAISSMV
jgi:hypothetical protein